MKLFPAPALALTTAGLLMLTGCGPSEEEQAFLDGMGCEDGESAEECGERRAEEMIADYEEGEEDDSPAPEAATQDEAQDTNEQPNEYPEQLATEQFGYGQHSVYRDPDTGAELGTLTVNSIDSNYECADKNVLAAEVELNLVGESTSVTVDPERFVFIDEEGNFIEGSSVADCDEGATLEAAAEDITTQLLVFDVQADAGSMALNTHESRAFWIF